MNMHIHQKPLLLRVLLGALEGGIDILVTTVTTKWQPDTRINNLGVSDRRIEIPEQVGIWCKLIPSQHSHNIVKQLRAAMALGLMWTNSQPKKFMIEERNLLGGRPNPTIK
jgi:hypothetical protein